MDIEEGKTLVRRVVSVIISCETDEQLYGALKYTMLFRGYISGIAGKIASHSVKNSVSVGLILDVA